jgi:hypothetical protein
VTSWLSSIKSLKRKREEINLLLHSTATKKKVIFNIPLLRFPTILQHFDLKEFQAMHICESNSENYLQLQWCEMLLNEHRTMFRVSFLERT